jgi:type II secretory pathway predicted ATPase ExeA
MFLDAYGLARNPFAQLVERPMLDTPSMREVATKLQRAAAGQLNCLVISGPAGVGKTMAVQEGLAYFDDWFRCWVNCPVDDARGFLHDLLNDLGLGDVEGEAGDLRNVLEVFLRHQAARKRPGLLVVDNLDSASREVLELLTWLMGLRLRGEPLLRVVLIARSDELAADLIPPADSQVGVLHQHQKYLGFTLDDTRDYILDCLDASGCTEPAQLFPELAIARVQGFSRGIPRRIDQLCAVAFNALAEGAASLNHRPTLDQAMIDNAANMLRFEYDPRALAIREEPLSREQIHENNQQTLRIDAARLVVASGGQLVAEVSLSRSRMVLGRDANCDITLDSRYVSRYQNLFLQTDSGWLMIDLNSTNGSFVNGKRVREYVLRNGDVIAVGNHQLRFYCTADERGGVDQGATAIRKTRVLREPGSAQLPQPGRSSTQTR